MLRLKFLVANYKINLARALYRKPEILVWMSQRILDIKAQEKFTKLLII